MKKRSKLQWVGLTLTSLGMALSGGTALASVEVKTGGGLTVVNKDCPMYWFKLGGRLHIDQTFFSGSANAKRGDFPSSANIRRGWVSLNGGVGNCLAYLMTMDFRGFERRSVIFQDAYLSYRGFGCDSTVAIGQFGLPFGLENWSDTNDLMFLEPSLMTSTFSWIPEPGLYATVTDTAITVPTTVGASAPYYAVPQSAGVRGLGLYGDLPFADMFTIAASITVPDANRATAGNPRASDRITVSARATFSPVHTEHMVYHLGVATRQQSYSHFQGGANIASGILSTTPEAMGRSISAGYSTTASLVNTGYMNTRNMKFWGVEAAALWGPFIAQAEWNTVHVGRQATTNVTFDGFHVQAAYMLTGESRRYDWKKGTFAGPCKPCNSCYGAWEVALRYSHVSLNDKDVYGGAENNTTLGVNWFFNKHVTVKANYVHARIAPIGATAGVKPASTPVKRTIDAFALRLQVAF
jgi:phosphate-selective porin OprO and OprP